MITPFGSPIDYSRLFEAGRLDRDYGYFYLGMANRERFHSPTKIPNFKKYLESENIFISIDKLCSIFKFLEECGLGVYKRRWGSRPPEFTKTTNIIGIMRDIVNFLK